MCILITGGAGFIGSNIAFQLYKSNLNVAICDWLGREDKWKNLQHIVPEDLIAPETLPQWLDQKGKNLAAIIHMGAISATTETDADLIIERNFRLSINLWRFCAAAAMDKRT